MAHLHVSGKHKRSIFMGKSLNDLWFFLQQGHLERFRETLGSIADINDKDRLGCTILHRYISSYEHLALDSSTVVTPLLEAGVDVNARENNIAQRRTALHLAALKGSLTLCTLLLDNGALIDPQDKYGNTPLWQAAMEYSLRKEDKRQVVGEVITLLLDRGVNPGLENDAGFSPLDIAQTVKGTDVLKYFQR